MRPSHKAIIASLKIFVLSATLFKGAAAADDPAWSAEKTFYSGVRVGNSINQNSCRPTNISCDKSDPGYGFFSGYYFTDRYSVEFSWNDVGDSHAAYPNMNLRGELTEIDISARISHSLRAHLNAYGKLGAAYWKGEITGGPWLLKDSGVRPLIGAGLEMSFAPRWALRLEYQYIDQVGNETMGWSDSNFIGLALVWRWRP